MYPHIQKEIPLLLAPTREAGKPRRPVQGPSAPLPAVGPPTLSAPLVLRAGRFRLGLRPCPVMGLMRDI